VSQTDFPFCVIPIAANKQIAAAYDSGTDFSFDQTLFTNNNAYTADDWFHLVVIARPSGGGNHEIFINGALASGGSVASTTNIGTSSRAYQIGAATAETGAGNGTTALTGKIAEFALYHTALSSTRIAAHYAARNN
jgi:hypothetical protein